MATPTHIIDVLKNSVRDIARPNYFEVEFSRASGRDLHLLRVTQNLVRSVDVPSTTMGDITIRRMGRKVTFPGATEFAQDLLMSIHNDVDGKTRNYIKRWQEDYYGRVGGGIFHDVHDLLRGEVAVYQLDNQHNRVVKYRFRHAYPKLLGGVDLSNETEDQVLSFPAGFAYAFYQMSVNVPNFSDIDDSV